MGASAEERESDRDRDLFVTPPDQRERQEREARSGLR